MRTLRALPSYQPEFQEVIDFRGQPGHAGGMLAVASDGPRVSRNTPGAHYDLVTRTEAEEDMGGCLQATPSRQHAQGFSGRRPPACALAHSTVTSDATAHQEGTRLERAGCANREL